MPELKYQVKYISNSCSQTDELLNKPHQSVAESLFDLLENHNEIQHPVIGLDGSWGSGKSQVISILQKLIDDKNLNKKYKFLTYDIWGAQEDLTRRSFLDSVLSDVKEDDIHFNNRQLKEDYEKLNATTTIRSTKSFPLVRLFFACILLIPVANYVVNSVEATFGYCKDASVSYDQVRGILSFVLSVLAIITFAVAYSEEHNEVNADKDVRGKSKWNKFQIIIGRLFYVFKAKDIEKTDFETIMKDEPSISRFQNIFNHVYKALKEDCVLVIVFDNMDRLSDSQKLMSTWSLLHTFFAEKQYDGKIWALVPFAKQQLSDLMKDNHTEKDNQAENQRTTEFINKTFFTSFRIPEPIMGSWKSFLNSKLDTAFSPMLDEEDKNYVTLIFSRSMAGRTIRPRDIITYVNRIIALYSQHYFEDVPLRYIALYAQYEFQINKQPIDSILQYKGFESMVPLVGKEYLSQWLSSIYYNLPSDSALEVVYDREIKNFLQCDYEIFGEKDEADETYETLSSNVLFHHHIEDYFNKDIDMSELILQNVFYLLRQNNISQGTRNRIYNTVSEQLEKLKDQLTQYQPWMENAFLNNDLSNTNKIISSLITNAKDSFETYYNTIIPLLKLRKNRKEINLFFREYKVESAKSMLEFYDYLVNENSTDLFKESRIVIDAEKLLDFMKDGATGNILFGSNTDKVYGLLQLMKNAKHNLKPISEEITNASINISSQEHSQVERIYRTFNIVTDNKNNIPQYTLFDSNGTKFLDIPEYLACSLVQLKKQGNNTNHINNCLSGNLKTNKDKINVIFPSYFYFDSLIATTLSSGNTMLKEICHILVEDKRSTINKFDELLSSTSTIIKDVFNDDSGNFISFLDSKVSNIKEKTGIKFVNIDIFWIDTMSNEAINEHPVYKAICDQWLLEFKEFVDSSWCEAFSKSNGNVSLILQKLSEIGVVNKSFWKSIPVDQVKDAFINTIVNNTEFDFNLFNNWKQNVSKATLAKLANDTKYSISNPKTIQNERFIHFVELLWENSELIKSSDTANAIYDDYISDYLSKNLNDHTGVFLYNHQSQIDYLVTSLSDDRKVLFVNKIKTLHSKLDEGSNVAKFLESLEKKYDVGL